MSVKIDELFYELEMRTAGFEAGVAKAQSSLSKFASFMAKNPVLVAGALGAAFVAVAAKAAQMADAVQRSLNLVQGSMALTSREVETLRGDLADLSKQTGRTQSDLAAMAREVAGNGLSSFTELQQVLRAGTEAADASGGDLQQTLRGLDTVLDTFSLNGAEAERVLAKLFVTAQGKTTLPALLEAFERLSPTVQKLGLDFDTTAAAVTTLINRGRTVRQLVSELAQMDAVGIRNLADDSRRASDGMAAMREQARLMRDAVDNDGARMAAQWDAVMVRMGNATAHFRSLLRPFLEDLLAVTEAWALGFKPPSGKENLPLNGVNPDTRLPKGPAPITPEQQKALEDWTKSAEDMLVGFTDTLVDDTVLALRRFKTEAEKSIANLNATGHTAEAEAMQRQLDILVAGYQRRLDEINRDEKQKLFDLASGAVEQKPGLSKTTQTSIPLRTAEAVQAAADAAEAKTKELAQSEQELADKRSAAIQAAQAQYQMTEQAARGALQLASALGIMNADLAQALTGLVQFAAGMQELQKFNKAGASSIEKFSAALGVVGAAASVISSIGKLFSSGPSPEELRRIEVETQNTEALAELTRHVGDLGKILGNTAGSTIANVQRALQSVADLAKGGGVVTTRPVGEGFLADELRKVGVSMADLLGVAKELNITFAGTIPTFQEVQKVLDALKAAELTQFAQSYAGQLQALRLEFELFDISDPLEQLKKLQALGKQFAGKSGGLGGTLGLPEVLNALGKLDLSTQEGRDAAAKALQSIFGQLKAGTLTPGQLGGLSPDELLAFLDEFKKTLDQANKSSAPQGETQGFNVSRTITEAQGNVVISTLTTVAYWQEALYRLFAGGVVTGALVPPPLPTSTAPAGTGTIDVTVYLSITGVLDAASATAMGTQVVDGMVAQLDTLYGAKLRTRKLLTGDAVRY